MLGPGVPLLRRFPDAFYEYRKDLTAFAAILLVLTLVRGIEEQRREAQTAKTDARATGTADAEKRRRDDFPRCPLLRLGGRCRQLCRGARRRQTHLACISLSALAEQLAEAGIQIARIHRSTIVNRAKVKRTAPLGDGDLPGDGRRRLGTARLATLPPGKRALTTPQLRQRAPSCRHGRRL